MFTALHSLNITVNLGLCMLRAGASFIAGWVLSLHLGRLPLHAAEHGPLFQSPLHHRRHPAGAGHDFWRSCGDWWSGRQWRVLAESLVMSHSRFQVLKLFWLFSYVSHSIPSLEVVLVVSSPVNSWLQSRVRPRPQFPGQGRCCALLPSPVLQ